MSKILDKPTDPRGRLGEDYWYLLRAYEIMLSILETNRDEFARRDLGLDLIDDNITDFRSRTIWYAPVK